MSMGTGRAARAGGGKTRRRYGRGWQKAAIEVRRVGGGGGARRTRRDRRVRRSGAGRREGGDWEDAYLEYERCDTYPRGFGGVIAAISGRLVWWGARELVEDGMEEDEGRAHDGHGGEWGERGPRKKKKRERGSSTRGGERKRWWDYIRREGLRMGEAEGIAKGHGGWSGFG